MPAESDRDSVPDTAASFDGVLTSSSMEGGAVPRRSGAPHSMKRVESRVPVNDVMEQPLLSQAKKLFNDQRSKYREDTRGFTWFDWLGWFMPCFVWLRTYEWRNWLLSDVAAGLSVGAMVVPQGMSYAKLAGLPQEYGLYGAFVPCIAYAVLGSSRQLAVGPVAVTSIMLANGLDSIIGSNADPNNPEDPDLQEKYNRAAIQVAFVAGCFYTGVGLLRMGWITNFLSHAQVSGFMTGAAILIGMSQVKYILGLTIARADKLQDYLELIFDNLWQFNWREFVMGMSFILLLLTFKHLSQRYRRLVFLKALGPLTVCIISIALMNIFKWRVAEHACASPSPVPCLGQPPQPVLVLAAIAAARCLTTVCACGFWWRRYQDYTGVVVTSDGKEKQQKAIANIGSIPSGLPGVTIGWWAPLYNVGRQMLLAVLICFIDICESISIAKALAQKNKYALNATQELRGLGVANLFGAAFNCYTTTGSFSRSAVNNEVGAKTPLANFVTGIMVMFVLLFLTGVFTNMSSNVQGAIIIVGVLGLIDYPEFIYLWRVNKLDFLVWNVAFLFTIFLGVEIGIIVSVCVSLLLVIYKVAFPRITTLGKLPGSEVYRSTKMYPNAELQAGMLLMRVDAPILFFNSPQVKEFILEKVAASKRRREEAGDRIRFVIMDMSPVTDIDSSAMHVLDDFVDELAADGIELILANPSQQVLLALKRSQLLTKIKEEFVHVNMGDAVNHAAAVLRHEQEPPVVVV